MEGEDVPALSDEDEIVTLLFVIFALTGTAEFSVVVDVVVVAVVVDDDVVCVSVDGVDVVDAAATVVVVVRG